MSLLIPIGFLQAVYELRLTGDPELMVVTCGHEVDDASGANYEDAPDDLFTAFATHIHEPLGMSHYSLEGVTVYCGNDGPPLVYTSSETPVPGDNVADTVPQNTAFLIRKRTDLAGRRGRGRFYYPGVNDTQVTNAGDVPSATQTLWQTQLDAWYAALTSGVGARLYPPVVLHRSEGAGVEPPPTPVTRFTIEARVATQRRRLRP